MEWLEEEYQRLIKQGKFDSGLQFNELMNEHEIAIINTGKVIYKRDLKHYFFDELSIEQEQPPFNVGKDFHSEWNGVNNKWKM